MDGWVSTAKLRELIDDARDRERRRIRRAQREAMRELRLWFGEGAIPPIYEWLGALDAATRRPRRKRP